MRMFTFVAAAVSAAVSASLLVATPTPAQAEDDYRVDRVSCRSNKNHYTDSDLFENLFTGRPTKMTWHTHANFKPDRITWSVAYDGASVFWVIASVGGASSTLNDVAYKGTTTNVDRLAPDRIVTAYRMSVYDEAFGNCSFAWVRP